LQLCVLGFGLLKDRDVRVRIFPERKEILIGGFRFGLITRQCVSPAQLQVRQCADGIADHDPAELHRVVGRIYVAGVFVAAPLGFYIQYFQERMGDPRSFSIAGAVDAALWMITTGIAMVFILKSKVQEHRQWMTRSFAVALVFLEVRVIGGVAGWESLDANVNETIVWVCLAFSILSADLVLEWQELERQRSVLYQRRSVSL